MDFAAARNAAVESADMVQWILVLDADERLEAGASGEDRGTDRRRMRMRAIFWSGTITRRIRAVMITDHVVRLFPNRTEYRVSGAGA